jgi:hypothetical protein
MLADPRPRTLGDGRQQVGQLGVPLLHHEPFGDIYSPRRLLGSQTIVSVGRRSPIVIVQNGRRGRRSSSSFRLDLRGGCVSWRSRESASIASRVAVSSRPFLPGTVPRIASTTERSQVRIALAPMRQRSPSPRVDSPTRGERARAPAGRARKGAPALTRQRRFYSARLMQKGRPESRPLPSRLGTGRTPRGLRHAFVAAHHAAQSRAEGLTTRRLYHNDHANLRCQLRSVQAEHR